MPNARKRQRRPGRQRPFREPKPTILVVSEGEVTEPEYLHGLQQACRNPRVTIRRNMSMGLRQLRYEISVAW